jgi:transposase
MPFTLTEVERRELEVAQQQSRNVRHWRRYQALLLRAVGVLVSVIATTLGCREGSITNWIKAWRARGVAGVHEGVHAGAARRLDAAGEQRLEALLPTDPQAVGYAATGWTVALLRSELAKGGWAASARTIRRTLHRRGWVWKRPQFVLGRPDPAYTEKKSPRRASRRDEGGRRGGVVRG